jgi:hypothetical protein
MRCNTYRNGAVSLTPGHVTLSALSLRVFGEDITVAGRQASIGKKGKSKSNEDVAQETPVPEAETDTESAHA